VKRSVTSHAPQGWAVRTGTMAMSDLEPAPDYEMIARACGHWAERVEDPTVLPEMVRQALRVVCEDKRPALLNVICKKP
jgi:acetolactate synthase I/II/III large subunit